MSKHTPVPWHTHDVDCECYGQWIHAQYVGQDGRRHHHAVADCYKIKGEYGNEGTDGENAAIIVRAVNCHDELLEACEGLIELIDAARMETLCQGSEWVAKLAKARAAVAKAKGESK